MVNEFFQSALWRFVGSTSSTAVRMVMGMEIIKDGIYAAKQIFGFFLGVIWCGEDDDDRGAAGFKYS